MNHIPMTWRELTSLVMTPIDRSASDVSNEVYRWRDQHGGEWTLRAGPASVGLDAEVP